MEGAGAFRAMRRCDEQRRAFRPGLYILAGMKLAPQEIRTYFVTTVTANRRRLFQASRYHEHVRILVGALDGCR
jgi:hypothetical protein